jgi:ATP-dependent protease HslVU (ClpYQ) peptidase subunit
LTTIAADARGGRLVICADSRVTSGDMWHPATKLFRCGDELVGCAGNVKEWQKWLQWHRDGRKRPRPKMEEIAILIVRRDGVYEHCGNGLEIMLERQYHAVGTGAHAALGAMMAGADVRSAVHIACQIDVHSGGEIAQMELT